MEEFQYVCVRQYNRQKGEPNTTLRMYEYTCSHRAADGSPSVWRSEQSAVLEQEEQEEVGGYRPRYSGTAPLPPDKQPGQTQAERNVRTTTQINKSHRGLTEKTGGKMWVKENQVKSRMSFL